MTAGQPLFQVQGLDVHFALRDAAVHAVRDLSLSVAAGECFAIVGESGSGKTQSMLAALGLLAANGRATGSVRFRGEELLAGPPGRVASLRGDRIAMIFQDPMTSLNPYLTVGRQLTEVLEQHRGQGGASAQAAALRALESVQIPDARRRLGQYPHECSGGMRQRIMIAMALLCEPDLLIADEPTTALDVTVQAQIVALLRELQASRGTAIVLITHDLGVVAGLADRVLVMRAGQAVEEAAADAIFHSPRDPYTQALLAAVPRLGATADSEAPAAAPHPPPLLRADEVQVHFKVRHGAWPWSPPARLRAVDGVSLALAPGEAVGLVGESGCGKSTLARALLNLVPVQGGSLAWLGQPLPFADRTAWQRVRSQAQMVFQDPLASLDPRMTIAQIVAEPLRTHQGHLATPVVRERVAAMLEKVGLGAEHMNRYPHEFSGGQCQRIGIARALILAPRLVVCDEPVSALDVSIKAQVVQLLSELRAELGLALLFISHDLAVVQLLCDRVLVMYLGKVVEVAPAAELYRRPLHPYTRALLDAVPVPDPRVERAKPAPALLGEPPSPLAVPSGCAFRSRCPHAMPRCAQETPALAPVGSSRVACWLY